MTNRSREVRLKFTCVERGAKRKSPRLRTDSGTDIAVRGGDRNANRRNRKRSPVADRVRSGIGLTAKRSTGTARSRFPGRHHYEDDDE